MGNACGSTSHLKDPLRGCFLRESIRDQATIWKTHGISFLWLLSPTCFLRKSAFSAYTQPIATPRNRSTIARNPWPRNNVITQQIFRRVNSRMTTGTWSLKSWKKSSLEKIGVFWWQAADFYWFLLGTESCNFWSWFQDVVLENWKTETSKWVGEYFSRRLVMYFWIHDVQIQSYTFIYIVAEMTPNFHVMVSYSYSFLSIQDAFLLIYILSS